MHRLHRTRISIYDDFNNGGVRLRELNSNRTGKITDTDVTLIHRL